MTSNKPFLQVKQDEERKHLNRNDIKLGVSVGIGKTIQMPKDKIIIGRIVGTIMSWYDDDNIMVAINNETNYRMVHYSNLYTVTPKEDQKIKTHITDAVLKLMIDLCKKKGIKVKTR